jgi:hypothetical protein
MEATIMELEARLSAVEASPQDNGTLDMIVRRPAHNEREVVESAELDLVEGVVGDNWRARGSKHTEDGSAMSGAQIAIMNSRIIHLLAQDRARWSLAGDQLYVDLDLSVENLPVGQRLAMGSTIIEITDVPHNGCDKFTERYGHDAIRFVNSREGRQARRRGVFARVVQAGAIHVGDRIVKVK